MTRDEAVGKKFNKLTITGWKRSASNGYKIIAECVCECGELTDVLMSNVLGNHTKSCGCHNVGMRGKCHLSHGHSRGKTYRIWSGMKTRCSNPNEKAYSDYGGRGIKVCDRWSGENGFVNFLADMGECPPGYSIERKDVNGNYEAGNCLWIPRIDQAKNRRGTIWITLNGETQTLTDWCEIKQMPWSRIHARISSGWPTEMLFAPKGATFKPKGIHNLKLTSESADEIRNLYRERNLTQTELAEKFGVSTSLINGIVLGKLWITPSPQT